MAPPGGWPVTNRGGEASLLPYTPASVTGGDNDDDDDKQTLSSEQIV